MSNVILTQNTNRSALTITPDDDLYLNGYTLTLDADLICANIYGGNSETQTGAGRIYVPSTTNPLNLKVSGEIGSFNHPTDAAIVSIHTSMKLNIEFYQLAWPIQQLLNTTSRTLQLSIKSTNPNPIICPSGSTSALINLVNNLSGSTVNIEGIFIGRNSSSDIRLFFNIQNLENLTFNGCLLGGEGSTSAHCMGVDYVQGTLTARTTGPYANQIVVARSGRGLHFVGAGSGRTLILNGDVIGSRSNSQSGLSFTAIYGLTINGNIYGGQYSGAPGISITDSSGATTVNGNIYGGTASGCHGIAIDGSSANANFTITGNVYGGSHSSAAGIYISTASGTATIQLNGSLFSGSAAPAIIQNNNLMNGRLTINGDLTATSQPALTFTGGAADAYINGNLIKQSSAYVITNTASSIGSYVCFGYGYQMRDGSGNPLSLNQVINANSNYPNDGYGWFVNAKLETAYDFLTAMQQLPYGRFVLAANLSITSTNYQAPNFYGSLFTPLTSSPYRLTNLSLSYGGSGVSLFAMMMNGSSVENIQIDNANTGTQQAVFTYFLSNGSIKRCTVKAGTTGGLVGFSVLTSNVISECYNRAGNILASGTATVDRCFKSVDDSTPGTYLNDTQAKQKASYVGWDFANIWDIDEGNDYPFLKYRQPNERLGLLGISGLLGFGKLLTQSKLLDNRGLLG